MSNLHQLDDALSTPAPDLVADLSALNGDIVVLGAAGKLGPSLVELALRGIDEAGSGARVHAVSRFSDSGLARRLEAMGADVVTADLHDDASLARLPDAPNVVYLAGVKFGTDGNEHATWATNTYLPGRVALRYRDARIAVLSTGNVYPLTPIALGGSSEGDPVGPVGEYAMSCLGRERVFTAISRAHNTPLSIIRLNYAIELRYGILIDIAKQILARRPVSLDTGLVNLVWQGYANEVILRSLLHASSDPEFVLNLTGPETLSVRKISVALARELGTDVEFEGEERETALLSDASLCHSLFGYPRVGPHELVPLVAAWLRSGGEVLDRPTKFAVRDGRF